ncbi:MAG: methyltransferase domain-containing protein [Planctomycetota bacterium]
MNDQNRDAVRKSTYAESVAFLLNEFAWNPWFLNSYWPENEPRIRLMSKLVTEQFKVGDRVMEVGCANGYVACLMNSLGFKVNAIDAYEDVKRTELFRKCSIGYQESNLNAVNPLQEFASNSMDVVLLGEVFEHILNNPAGLLKALYRILRPGGMLILSTPNPSNIMNAIRLLQDKYVLWGTNEFINETKLSGDKIIDRGDIHYREYPAWLVRDVMIQTGFDIRGMHYIRTGIAPQQSASKRLAKHLLELVSLVNMRLFSSEYVIWATKPS